MMHTGYFAFYGSLRRGMPLHNQFQPYLDYEFSIWLKGFDLFSLGAYPYAVRSTDPMSKILAEIYRIDDQDTGSKIHSIEIDAGYEMMDLEISGKKIHLYLFKKGGNDPKVIGGDWVDFFGR